MSDTVVDVLLIVLGLVILLCSALMAGQCRNGK